MLAMISVQEALKITLENSSKIGEERTPVTEAAGFILAENIVSNIDLPPFNKASMDGYALKAKDSVNAPVVLEVIGMIPAGVVSDLTVNEGQVVKIMTGAPVPEGADCVQMIEKTEAAGKNRVRILESVTKGKNIAEKREVIKKNQKVFEKGTYLSPAVIAVLSAFGKAAIKIYRRPEVSIIVTGDEIVDIEQNPNAGQIRNSNGYALFHQVRQAGGMPKLLGIAKDNIEDLRPIIARGIKSDVLLISGGVSMGDFDFVEDAMAEFNIKIYYDQVNVKPGKPTVFGKINNTLVFGLPGNPVSASTIFELIVRPAIRKILGFANLNHITTQAILKEDFSSKTKRENYQPAYSYLADNIFYTTPLKSKGSADILAFSKSNSYIKTSESQTEFKTGEKVTILLRDEFWRNHLL